jgi:hypothetical protein
MKTLQLTQDELEWIEALVKNYIEELNENLENPVSFVNGNGLEYKFKAGFEKDKEQLSNLLNKVNEL